MMKSGCSSACPVFDAADQLLHEHATCGVWRSGAIANRRRQRATKNSCAARRKLHDHIRWEEGLFETVQQAAKDSRLCPRRPSSNRIGRLACEAQSVCG
jgi:hypothetical protein